MILALLLTGLLDVKTPDTAYLTLKIQCASRVALCNSGTVNGGIFANLEETVAEADRISKEGCWMDGIKLTCTSVRSIEAYEKLAPGGISSISIVLVP